MSQKAFKNTLVSLKSVVITQRKFKMSLNEEYYKCMVFLSPAISIQISSQWEMRQMWLVNTTYLGAEGWLSHLYPREPELSASTHTGWLQLLVSLAPGDPTIFWPLWVSTDTNRTHINKIKINLKKSIYFYFKKMTIRPARWLSG